MYRKRVSKLFNQMIVNIAKIPICPTPNSGVPAAGVDR